LYVLLDKCLVWICFSLSDAGVPAGGDVDESVDDDDADDQARHLIVSVDVSFVWVVKE
jgi:hypothetical protein